MESTRGKDFQLRDHTKFHQSNSFEEYAKFSRVHGRMVEGSKARRASPVIAAVSRDSWTNRRTRTPRLYLHCTLLGPRRGNLEGKREQCHVRSGAYMRISVRSPGNRHLRIIGCCAEAATLAGQSKKVGRERDQRLGVVPRRHWPPLIFPGAFFISFLPLRRHHRRPPRCVPLSIPLVPLHQAGTLLFISLALASSPISPLYRANSNIPSALSCALISLGRALRSFFLPLAPSFLPLSFRLSLFPLSLSLSPRLAFSLSPPTSVRRCRPTITLRVFLYSLPSFLPRSRRFTTARLVLFSF